MLNDRSSTAHNVLLVPMHLDALCLPTAENVRESDYLYPDLSGILPPDQRPSAVTVPFPRTNQRTGPYQPFRHMGRAVERAAWILRRRRIGRSSMS